MYVIRDKEQTNKAYVIEAISLATNQSFYVREINSETFRVCITVPHLAAKQGVKVAALSEFDTEAEAVELFWAILNALDAGRSYLGCEKAVKKLKTLSVAIPVKYVTIV